jgi:hypothetical protein
VVRPAIAGRPAVAGNVHHRGARVGTRASEVAMATPSVRFVDREADGQAGSESDLPRARRGAYGEALTQVVRTDTTNASLCSHTRCREESATFPSQPA